MQVKKYYSWFDSEELITGEETPQDVMFNTFYVLTADEGKSLFFNGVSFGETAETDNINGWKEK